MPEPDAEAWNGYRRQVVGMLDSHEERITDHGERITRMEEKHLSLSKDVERNSLSIRDADPHRTPHPFTVPEAAPGVVSRVLTHPALPWTLAILAILVAMALLIVGLTDKNAADFNPVPTATP